MGNFIKSEPGTKRPNLSTDRIVFFCICTTRQVSFESVKKFLRTCDNKKNQRWPTAAMFVDGLEFFLVLAKLDTEGNILTKFQKHPTSGLGGDATVGLTPESSQTQRKALKYVQNEIAFKFR